VADTLLVANKSDATVDLLDLESGKSRATLPTGDGPHEISISGDGRTAVISNYGTRETRGSTLTVVDVVKAEVTRTIDLGRHTSPHGMTWLSKTTLAVTTEGSEHLLVVDVSQGKIASAIETGQEISHMVAVTPDGKRAFVTNIRSGSVTVIDLGRGEKIRDIRTGDGAEGLAITPDGTQVWVTNRAAGTLSVLDTSTLEIVATIDCRGFPIRVAFTPDGRRALVSCARSGEVVVFDVTGRQELRRSKLNLKNAPDSSTRLFGDRFGQSPVPVGLVIAPDGKSAWVAATQSDVVVIVDTQTLEVRDLLRAGREPDGMALSPL
jgi:YVTN family beta-propeller protein